MFRKLLTLIALLAPLYSGTAQNLGHLLPPDSFVVLGTKNLEDHSTRLQVFIDEFQRQNVLSALMVLFPDESGTLPNQSDNLIPLDYAGLTLLDLLGQEAWVGLSASSFSLLPAITLVSRTAPNATAVFGQQIAEAASTPGVTTLTEGDFIFYQTEIDRDGFPGVVVYAQVGDVLLLGTNPDNVRGALRRLAGSEEPSFITTDIYNNTLGRLGTGNFSGYLDLSTVARLGKRFGLGFGLDDLVKRVSAAIDTSGTLAVMLQITPHGLLAAGAQTLNPSGDDAELFRLLSDPTPVPREALAYIPETAWAVTLSQINLPGWWNWLNGLVASTPDLGGDLDTLLFMFLGLDLRTAFLDWSGPQVATITMGTGDVIEPGKTNLNLLGETVYLVETVNRKAAQVGLNQLLVSLADGIAAFADPSGGDGNSSATSRDVAGIKVTSVTAMPGVKISFAIAGNFAVIATNDASMDAVLETFSTGNASLRPALSTLMSEVPDHVRSVNLIDTGETLELIAEDLPSQLQLMAGLGGADNLDFNAVRTAVQTIENYLNFISYRLGGSVVYRQVKDGVILTFGKNEVSW
jgi:hypothetical protein